MTTTTPHYWRLGLVGHPVGHSQSPQLHTAFLKQAGLSGEYLLYDTPADKLAERLAQFQAEQVTGFNVTIPHKAAVVPLLGALTPAAQAMGVVNTVRWVPAQHHWQGHNTDAAGWWASLGATAQARVPTGPALVLGAGGASRAVLYALWQAGCPQVVVAARNPAKAQDALAHWLEALGQLVTFVPLEEAALLPWADTAVLLVNTTPLGMEGYPAVSPVSDEALARFVTRPTCADLIYTPAETVFLQVARQLDYPTVGGMGMLKGQAALAFEWWTGADVKV